MYIISKGANNIHSFMGKYCVISISLSIGPFVYGMEIFLEATVNHEIQSIEYNAQ